MDYNFDFNGFQKEQDARVRGNFDAGTSALMSRLLRATLGEVIEYKYAPTLWANEELISFDRSINEGATSVDWYMESDVAPAADGWSSANGAIPFADIATDPNNNQVHGRLDGYSYTLDEVAQYAFMGMGSIVQKKARATVRNRSNRFNAAILSGVTGKFTGVINAPGSSQLVAGTTDNTTAAWVLSASPDNIVETLETVRQTFETRTSGNIVPDTVAFPSSIAIALRRQKSLVSETILQWLQTQFPEITKWAFDPRLNTAGVGGTAAMIMYARGSEYLSALVPLDMQPMPVFIKHQVAEQGFRTKYAGLVVPYAGSIAVCSNI
jgi:hypothetical protein